MPKPPDANQMRAQQKAASAQSMGYPTKKSATELEAVIAKQTKDFQPTGQKQTARLEALAPFTINAAAGTCYTVVMRLGEGAAWGPGAEAGLRFDFQTPTVRGSGGPGVTGPGAVVSVDCAEADGPITLTMAPMLAGDPDPIGKGPLELEVFSHKLTPEEHAHREADKQRQIKEQQEFARQEEAKRQQRASTGCSKCDARYQGCIGSGRSRSACRDEYGSCAFHEVGADYMSACPNPSY
jgi:hypothetical protein